MYSRSTRRAGFGIHRGSLNSQSYTQGDAPPIPDNNNIWIKTTAPYGIYVYDDDSETWVDAMAEHSHDERYLSLSNVITYTPTSNYHPATKKYVDDSISSNTLSDITVSGYVHANTLKVGDVVNGSYTEIEADGTIKFNGEATVWDDLVMPLTAGRRGANSTPEFDYVNIGYLFPQNNTAEKLYLVMQMPHGYKEGSKIYPHIHWVQTTASNVTWVIDYKWTSTCATVSTDFTTLLMTQTVCTYSSGNLHQISESLNGIDGTGKDISSMLAIKLYRDDNIYTGDALAYQFDIHYEIDTIGSRKEFIK